MARPADAPSGRIKPGQADQVLISAMVSVSASMFDDSWREVALHLIERALPLATSSSRMDRLKPVAQALIEAAPDRGKPFGASAWAQACMALDVAISRDALERALALVDVA